MRQSHSIIYLIKPRSKITATGSRMILQERSGNVAGSCRKALEIAGSGSSIPTGNLLDFFRWIPVNFLCFPAGTGRKSSEKIRKISGGNTASTLQRFPVLSCRNRPVIFDLGTYHMNIDQRYESFQPRNKTLFVILILVPD